MATSVKYLSYKSLAELYQYYIEEFVAKSPIISVCGCRIHCYEHHFVHVVKLTHPDNPHFFFADVKEEIMNTADGFGRYRHDTLRSRWLLNIRTVLEAPDCVMRPEDLRTSDKIFIKEFRNNTYSYVGVLVGRDEEKLTLRTAFPFRKGRLKRWMRGECLYPKTPQPPVKAAV